VIIGTISQPANVAVEGATVAGEAPATAAEGPTIESLRHGGHSKFPPGAAFVPPGRMCNTPKLLHQTWKNRVIPSVFTPHIDSWLTNHPKWEYRFYTDGDILRFIKERFPEYLQMFKVHTHQPHAPTTHAPTD
jgi:hypothetical protein